MFVLEDRGLILDAAQQPPEGRIAYFTSLCRAPLGHHPVRLPERARQACPDQYHSLVPIARWRAVLGAVARAV